MRVLDTEFATHITSGDTNLCTCWRLTRADGTVLGFTDHDVSIRFADTVFDPATGGDGSERAAKLGGAVDTSELAAVLTSEAITEDEIRLGRYDGTRIEIWRVNWRNPDMRHLVRRDRIGEITLKDKVFTAELRSAQSDLNREQGRFYQALCGTQLGTKACGINIDDDAYRTTGTVLSVADASRIRIDGLSAFETGWFSFGRLTWTSGRKSGLTDRVVAHGRDLKGDWLELDNVVANWVAKGDGFLLVAGCDRLFSTCRDRFANSVNFRGFPHIPGSDFVLSYPKQGDALAGAPLVK